MEPYTSLYLSGFIILTNKIIFEIKILFAVGHIGLNKYNLNSVRQIPVGLVLQPDGANRTANEHVWVGHEQRGLAHLGHVRYNEERATHLKYYIDKQNKKNI